MGVKVTNIGRKTRFIMNTRRPLWAGLLVGVLLALGPSYLLLQQFEPELLARIKALTGSLAPASPPRQPVDLLAARRTEAELRLVTLRHGLNALKRDIQENTLNYARLSVLLNQGKARYQAGLRATDHPLFFAGTTHANLETLRIWLEQRYASRNVVAGRLETLWQQQEQQRLLVRELTAWQTRAADGLSASGAALSQERAAALLLELGNPPPDLQLTRAPPFADARTRGLLVPRSVTPEDSGIDAEDFASFLRRPEPVGYFDWQNYWLYALGEAEPPTTHPLPPLPERRALALRAATLGLLETLGAVRLNAETPLQAVIDANPAIRGKLTALANQVEIVDEWHGDDGSIQLLTRLPLLGRTGLLAALTPLELRRLAQLDSGSRWPASKLEQPGYTGLVVDTRGIKAKPALFPRLLTRSGRIVYDLTVSDPNELVKRGLFIYGRSLAALKTDLHLGDHPLVIKATEAMGMERVDLVLEDWLGEVVMAAAAQPGFLAAARVGILLD